MKHGHKGYEKQMRRGQIGNELEAAYMSIRVGKSVEDKWRHVCGECNVFFFEMTAIDGTSRGQNSRDEPSFDACDVF